MISFVLAQILSRLIHESNIWSLGHFFIALVKARLLNWFKCLECRHYFFPVFLGVKRQARSERGARDTRGRGKAPSAIECVSCLFACFVLRSPEKWAPVLKTRTTPISMYSVSLPYFSIAFVNFCHCPFC